MLIFERSIYMKRIFKSTIIAILVVAMLSSTMPLFALAATPEATTPEPDVEVTSLVMGGNTYPYFTAGDALVTNTSWQTIATSTTGFNCNVYIRCYNTAIVGLRAARSSIRMLGKSGNVVWEEAGAIAGEGYRIFACGSDVYTIQIKTEAGKGTAYAYQTTDAAT